MCVCRHSRSNVVRDEHELQDGGGAAACEFQIFIGCRCRCLEDLGGIEERGREDRGEREGKAEEGRGIFAYGGRTDGGGTDG